MANSFLKAALAVLVFATLALPAVPAAQQEPSLQALVTAAAEYTSIYSARMSGVLLDEELLLTEVIPGSRNVPVRLSSDLVFVLAGEGLITLRDPYSIDRSAIREKQPRILEILASPTPETWKRAQAYAREHAVYLRANVVIWFSDPALVFQCLAEQNRARLTFKLEGRKRLNGVQTYGLGFKEALDPDGRTILDIPGKPRVSGRFWVEWPTGRIHQTEFWPQSDKDNARVQVQYTQDEKLNLLIPREAAHTFTAKEIGFAVTGTGGAGYDGRMTFESTARYSNPRYTPIDLRRAGGGAQ